MTVQALLEKKVSRKKFLALLGGGALAVTLLPSVFAKMFIRKTDGTLLDLDNVGASAGAYVNKAGDTMTGDLRTTDLITTRSVTITRTDGLISSVTKASGRTITINRDGNGVISSTTDGTNTWTINRDSNGAITGVTVT